MVHESILLAEHSAGTLPGGMAAMESGFWDQNATNFAKDICVAKYCLSCTKCKHIFNFVLWLSPGIRLPTSGGVGEAHGLFSSFFVFARNMHI